MKVVMHNEDNLKEEEITEVVLRAKAVLLNNENILFANEDNVLQFPGGHVEEGEKLETCLKREILEETGIEIEDNEIGKCFQKVIFMNKDWPSAGKNRKCEIYYYEVKTNKLPDLSKVHLTESEKNQHFKVDGGGCLMENYVNNKNIEKVNCELKYFEELIPFFLKEKYDE